MKFNAFLEMAFTAPPSSAYFWRNLILGCRAKRQPDLPGLFGRMTAHLVATGNPGLPWLYASAAICLQDDHPEFRDGFGDFFTALQ